MKMETDQLAKSLSIDGASFHGSVLSPTNMLISPVTLQMQKHLLTSTLVQTNSESAGRMRSGRTGSCSPTPALPFTPTPSPSPFNPLSLSMNSSLPDLSLSYSGDSKAMSFLQDTKTNSFSTPAASYEDLDDCRRSGTNGGSKFDMGMSNIPMGAVSPQMEINSVLNFSEQRNPVQDVPVSSHQDNLKGFIVVDADGVSNVSSSISLLPSTHSSQDNNIRLLSLSDSNKGVKLLPASITSEMTPPVNIIPKQDSAIRLVPELQPSCITTLKPVQSSGQLACLAAIPAVTTQQIACITNLPTPVSTQIACLSAVPSLSSLDSLQCLPSSSSNAGGIISAGYDSYTSPIIQPNNKKRRLLTFLTGENDVETVCPDNKQEQNTSILVDGVEPAKSDTFILSSNCPSLVSVSSNSPTLIIGPSNSSAINSVSKAEPALFLNSGNSLVAEAKNTSSGLYLSEDGGQLQSTKSSGQAGGGVFLEQENSIEKGEQTLIINSDGTQATLITPVSAAQPQLLASQPQVGTILGPVSASPAGLISGQIVQGDQLIQTGGVLSQSYMSKANYSAGPVLSGSTLSFRPVLNTSFSVDSLSAAAVTSTAREMGNLIVDPATVQYAADNREQCKVTTTPSNLIEKMSVFKCKLCGFIGTTAECVELHIIDEHEESISQSSYEEEQNWVKVAQRESVKLHCPLCANLFTSERSFKVHLTEDHQLTDTAAALHFEKENGERRAITLRLIREEKEKLKLERRRSKQQGYEAYVNDSGELRVRSTASKQLLVAVNGGALSVPDKDDQSDDGPIGEEQIDFDMKASDYVKVVLKGNSVPVLQDRAAARERKKTVREKVGRPKGSRSVGLTLIKKVNPNVALSDQLMGEECGVNNCAVRLKDLTKLNLHRTSHIETGHQCPECNDTFPSWSKCALHLWRQHNQDMELYKCSICPYRSFTHTVLERHKTTHKIDKPFLCPDCGRALKNDKQLKEHMRTVHQSTIDGVHIERDEDLFECDRCKQKMSSMRELKYHKERVHERKKTLLCIHCGYAAFNNSSLKLHMRLHTGDKPYACKVCSYRTSDHNSLRRHSLRHSGERPYRCPHCPYAAIQSSVYKMHLKKKHPHAGGDLFQCDQCSFVTVKEKLFLAHKNGHKEHSNNKENREDNTSDKLINPTDSSPRSV